LSRTAHVYVNSRTNHLTTTKIDNAQQLTSTETK